MPDRIQRRRAKGWTLPPNAVCITRPGPWGNPFVTGVDGMAAECVDLYAKLLAGYHCLSCKATAEAQRAAHDYVHAHWRELRGRDLACWCRAGMPCHGDVLLKVANART